MTGDEVRRVALSFPEAVEKETAFFVPSHAGSTVGSASGRSVSIPEEMGELIEDAWRPTAPARVVAAYDGGR